ncbi:MAG: transglycosylase SLT domain-containing protein [Acidobacteria bacterium]|nr:transglycosylase SLT domain-containing protein [Acidobacteriota bacterium]
MNRTRHQIVRAACLAVVLLLPDGTHDRASLARPGGSARVSAAAGDPAVLDASTLWLVPSPRDASRPRSQGSAKAAQLAKAVELYADGKYADALRVLNPEVFDGSELAAYVAYYRGLTELALESFDQARQTFRAVTQMHPIGCLSEAAALAEAEAAEATQDFAAAARIYETLSQQKTMAPDDVLLRLARAELARGDLARAATAYVRVYFEFPMGDAAAAAATEMTKVDLQPVGPQNGRYKLELGRGERLFGARRYADARRSFELVQPYASGDEHELVELRLAESDYYLQRYRNARQALKPYTEHARRKSEALFFYLSAVRALGEQDTYVELSQQLVAQFPDSSWAEEALNNLGSHYIRINEDDRAADTFAELYQKYPDSRYGDRAAWKAGWWAFKHGRYEETIRLFADAAVRFPHSDSRPAFQYWAARAHEKLGRQADARAAFAAVTRDYGSSYYGRLAASKSQVAAVVRASDQSPLEVDPGVPPPTADLIRQLLSLKLYDAATNELLYAQRIWGSSPIIDATLGWIYHEQGDLRRGINAMKRAYPVYLSAAGRLLPDELLKIIFPLDQWDLIRKHAAARDLDPYLIAALIAQESTFTPDIRSSAGAIGMMQIMPSTGRQLARALKIPRYRVSMLTRPDVNIRMGMLYFSNLVKRFGGAYFALASYNAGDHRVARWLAERPGLEQDEFVDDIPFPETQNYVKKVLGTAEDYRIIYGGPSKTTDPVRKTAGS